MEVQGRIDRIDYNSKSNEWHVIDYKTGDRLRTSNYIYREGEGWSDLQLPLYRRVLRSRLGKDAQIKIGYLSLGAAQSEVDLCEIDMGEPELEEAWECAKNVAAKIAGGEFWPPSEEVYHGDELGTLLRFVRSYHGAELEGDF